MAEGNEEYVNGRASHQFQPGNTAAKGRGQNKVSTKVKESIVNFLEANVDKIQADFDTLKAKDRLQFIAEILPYAAPKLASIQHEGEVHAGITIRFDDSRDYVYPSEDKSNTGIPESV
jgi:hypothetical protein